MLNMMGKLAVLTALTGCEALGVTEADQREMRLHVEHACAESGHLTVSADGRNANDTADTSKRIELPSPK